MQRPTAPRQVSLQLVGFLAIYFIPNCHSTSLLEMNRAEVEYSICLFEFKFKLCVDLGQLYFVVCQWYIRLKTHVCL